MIMSDVVAAASQTKSPNGALGLLVFLVLVFAVYLLFRSMTRHLRKAQQMKLDEEQRPEPRDPPGR
jgi:hypothetical protein